MSCNRCLFIAIALVVALATGCGNNKGGKLVALQITPEHRVIATGSSEQFTAMARFGDGTIVNWTSATEWSTSDETLVKISNSFNTYGHVDSISYAPAGAVIITGKDIANNISSTATLSIVDPLAIFIYASNPYTVKNAKHQFRADAFLSTDPTVTLQNLTSRMTWTTSPDDPVARISKSGLVTTTSQTGTSVLSATYEYYVKDISGTPVLTSVSGTTLITVKDAKLDSLAISSDVTGTVISLSTGTILFDATATFSDNSTESFTESAHWTSSNHKVATIGDGPSSSNYPGTKGVCTLQGAGKVTIKATDPITGRYHQQTFTVSSP